MSEKEKQINFLSGDEAIGRGAFEAGLCVAASYPGTPATEILEYLAGYDEVDAQWSINEKVAYEVAFGAAVSGSRAMYSSKHVGVNVAMDALMTSAYIGVNAGFVAVTADDPGLHSSQNEQDNRLISQFAKIPLIQPASPREAYEFAQTAFDISEEFDTPVLFRITTRIAHTKENITVGERIDIPKKEYVANPSKNVMVPGYAYKRHIVLEEKLLKLKQYSEKTSMNKIEMGSKEMGFITDSVSYLYVKEAFPEASVLKLGFTYPFCDEKIKAFAKEVKELYVIEELEPFIEDHLKTLGLKIHAKHESWRVGELRPEDIVSITEGKPRTEKPKSSRKPVLCPGCSHRPVYTVLKKHKVVVTGDIGCYTLGALKPLEAMQTCLCMGASITMFEGFYRSLGKGVVAVIGDSTFVHSGIPGLINAAYNGAKGLVMILDNGTTAMTGSQPHPGTGVNVKGKTYNKISIEDICKAAGAKNVNVVNPFETKELDALVKEAVSKDELSVIIARFPCRIIHRKKEKHPLYIKENCKKCGLCVKIDCPALIGHDDGYISIDPGLCTGCYLCVKTCAFKALEVEKK